MRRFLERYCKPRMACHPYTGLQRSVAVLIFQETNTMNQEQENRLNTPSRDLLTRAIDAAEFGCDALNELNSLFQAIATASKDYSNAHDLANIGQYLCENWAGVLDCEQEKLKSKRGGQANV